MSGGPEIPRSQDSTSSTAANRYDGIRGILKQAVVNAEYELGNLWREDAMDESGPIKKVLRERRQALSDFDDLVGMAAPDPCECGLPAGIGDHRC